VALSVIRTVPEREPVAVGWNWTLIVQVPPAATEVPHVLVCEKSAGFVPLIETLVMFSADVAVFVSVMLCGELMTPSGWLAKVSEEGESRTELEFPVPVSVAGIGAIVEANVTFNEALRAPPAVGLNVTLIVQEPPAPTVAQLLVCEKSPGFAPCSETVETRTEPVPLLVSVNTWAADLVPTLTVPKSELLGVMLPTVPDPLSATPCGLPVAESITERVPVNAPFDKGVNVTEIVHLAPTASVAVQVLVCPKPPLGRMAVSVTDVVPVLVSVTVFGALVVPLSCVPNARLVGDNDTVAAA
jgi:hypothetical protein